MSNQKFADRTAFLDHAKKLGEQEAGGLLRRPQFVEDLSIATSEGVLDPGNKPDAADAWTSFRFKVANKIDGQVISVEKSEKVRISEMRAVMIASAMTGVDFPGVLQRARKIICEAKANNVKLVGNTTDCFVQLARKQAAVEGRSLDDDEILDGIQPAQKDKARTEEALLKAQIKQLTVILEGTEGTENSPPKQAFPSPELKTAIAQLELRLATLTYNAAVTKAA
jgi:hypothetical protein